MGGAFASRTGPYRTLRVFLTVFDPAFPETTLKEAVTRPIFAGRILTLTVRFEPALIAPTVEVALIPLPETTTLTPVARTHAGVRDRHPECGGPTFAQISRTIHGKAVDDYEAVQHDRDVVGEVVGDRKVRECVPVQTADRQCVRPGARGETCLPNRRCRLLFRRGRRRSRK